MKNIVLLSAACLLFSACLKDDLDPATLTTNPLDLAYDGTPLVVLEHDTVRITENAQGLPQDTIFEQTVRVRTELLSPLTSWTWRITDLNTGQTWNSGSSTSYTTTITSPQLGNTYCFQYTLIVQYAPTKPYSICSVANL